MNNIFLLQNENEAFKIIEQMARIQCVQELDKKGFSDVFSLIGLSPDLRKAEKIQRKYFRDGEVNLLFIAKNKEEISEQITPFKKEKRQITREAAINIWKLFFGLILKNLFETRNELNFIHNPNGTNQKDYFSYIIFGKAIGLHSLFKDMQLTPYVKSDTRFLNKFELAKELISKEEFKELFKENVKHIYETQNFSYYALRELTPSKKEEFQQYFLEKIDLIFEIADPYL